MTCLSVEPECLSHMRDMGYAIGITQASALTRSGYNS